jgi:hypothetical protein
MTEGTGRNGPDGFLALDQAIIARPNACENHGWSTAVELAGAAVTPAGIERLAGQFEAHSPAQASASPFGHRNGLGRAFPPVN